MRQELVSEKILEENDGVETSINCVKNLPGQMLLSWVDESGLGKLECPGCDKDIIQSSIQSESQNYLPATIPGCDGNSKPCAVGDEEVDNIASPETVVIGSSPRSCPTVVDAEILQSNANQIQGVSMIPAVDETHKATDPIKINDVAEMAIVDKIHEVSSDTSDDVSKNESHSNNMIVSTINKVTDRQNVLQTGIGNIVKSVVVEHDSSLDSQIVVRKEADTRKLQHAFDAIKMFRSNGEEKQNLLYNIILKLKEKNCEIRMEHSQFVHPVATTQINDLAVKLIQSQKEYGDVKRKCKDLEMQVKDLKKEKEDELYIRKQKAQEELEQKKISSDAQESKINMMTEKIRERDEKCCELEKSQEVNAKLIQELERELALKEQKISDYKLINDDLRQNIAKLVNENKEIKKKEDELSNKLAVMQVVAGTVAEGGDSDQLVVITKEASNIDLKDKEQEISTLKRKVNECNKKNSLLIDELQEKRTNLGAIDNFYKDIINQKDQVISEYISILENDNEDTVKLKRLLTKFRTDSEMNLIRELKSSLEKDKTIRDAEVEKENGDGNQTKKVSSETSLPGDTRKNTMGTREASNDCAANPVVKLAPVVKKLCKFGKKCDTTDCKFSHDYVQKSCRFWPSCKKGESCLFMHASNDVACGHGSASDSKRYAVQASSNVGAMQGLPWSSRIWHVVFSPIKCHRRSNQQ